jgi:hypothetical protein
MNAFNSRGGHDTSGGTSSALGTFERIDLPDILLFGQIFGCESSYRSQCEQKRETGAIPDKIPAAVFNIIFHLVSLYMPEKDCIEQIYRNFYIEE